MDLARATDLKDLRRLTLSEVLSGVGTLAHKEKQAWWTYRHHKFATKHTEKYANIAAHKVTETTMTLRNNEVVSPEALPPSESVLFPEDWLDDAVLLLLSSDDMS